MDRRKKGTRALKYPNLKAVEYATIKRRGNVVLELSSNEIPENMPWRDFQKLVGSKIGSGIFYFSMKFKNGAEIYSGKTNAVDEVGVVNKNNIDTDQVLKKFNELEKKIDSAKSGDINQDLLITTIKQGYENQLNFKDMQINDIKLKLEESKTDLASAENDLDDCMEERAQLIKEGEFNLKEVLQTGGKLLQAWGGKGKPVSLESSDQTDIPKQILELLGVVDWARIDDEALEVITEKMRNYLSFLPLKGAQTK